MHMIFKIELIW